MGIGAPEILIVILVVALLFGASRLPLLGRNVGQGIKEFKKGVREASDDTDTRTDNAGKPVTEERGGQPQP